MLRLTYAQAGPGLDDPLVSVISRSDPFNWAHGNMRLSNHSTWPVLPTNTETISSTNKSSIQFWELNSVTARVKNYNSCVTFFFLPCFFLKLCKIENETILWLEDSDSKSDLKIVTFSPCLSVLFVPYKVGTRQGASNWINDWHRTFSRYKWPTLAMSCYRISSYI